MDENLFVEYHNPGCIYIYTRVVRKVLRLCLYLKKYSSLENKTYTILKNSYLLICMQKKKYICSDMNRDIGFQDNTGNAPRSTSENVIFCGLLLSINQSLY